MINGWSYRQYTFYRISLGIYLLIHFLYLLPYGTEVFSHQGMLSNSTFSPIIHAFPNIFLWFDSPIIVSLILTLGALASILLICGRFDRTAAFCLWLILTSLFGRNPLIANPSLPFIGWLLLAHLFIPPKPKDKFAPWQLPNGIFTAAWIVMAIGYSYSGFTKLSSPSWMDGTALFEVLSSPLARNNFFVNGLLYFPLLLKLLSYSTLVLELLFAPLACLKKLRPYLWLTLLSMHIGLLFFLKFVDLSMGMIILHLFTFNPAWVPAKKSKSPLKIFYDGSCGLCHQFVQFILQEMPQDRLSFSFAPQEGNQKSIVVYDETIQSHLYKTKAIIAILNHLGGFYRLFALLLIVLPFTDFFYDLIARFRHKFFSKPSTNCPLIPSHLQKLFLET